MQFGMALHPVANTENTDSWGDFYGNHANAFHGSQSVEPRWSSGVHMADTELEEGEACDDPDSNCDPDTAFSYIDEKLRVVLGDVQKEFEGGVSAEKLGSKFGGYGSFLPTHERTPSLLLQSNIPAIQVNDTSQTKKSPSEGVVERIKRIATGSSFGVTHERESSGLVALPNDDVCKNSENVKRNIGDTTLTTLKNSVVSDNISGDQKKFTLRIKMGSDADTRRKNSAIYSGLGLEHSSSASLEDDEDDQRSVSESSPDRSPLSMIQAMTSHQLPGGFLLSPLPDLISDPFEQKVKVPFVSVESHKTRLPTASKVETVQGFLTTKNDREPSKDTSKLNEKKERPKEKTRENLNDQKEEGGVEVNFSQKVKRDDSERSVRDNSQGIFKIHAKASLRDSYKFQDTALERPDRDAASESGKGVKSFEAGREPKGSMKDNGNSGSLDCTKERVKDVQKELGSPLESAKEESSKDQLKGNKSGKRVVDNNFKDQFCVLDQVREAGKELASGELVADERKLKEASGDIAHKKQSGTKEVNLVRKEKSAIKDASKQSSKDKGARRMTAPDVPSADKEFGKETAGDGKRKSKNTFKDGHASRDLARGKSRDLARGKSKDSSKEALKDIRREDSKQMLDKEAMTESTKGHRDSAKLSVKDSHRESLKELAKKQSADQRKKETLKEVKGSEVTNKDFSRLVDKEREREREKAVARDSGSKKAELTVRLDYDVATSCPDPQALRGTVAGLPSVVADPAPAVAAPVIILENWVQCDKCETWRLLPPGIQPENLPETWQCKNLYWLPGMNHCRFTQEQTTQALYAQLGIPQPQPPVQVDPLVGQPPAGVASAPSTDGKQEIQKEEMGVPKLTKSTSGKKRKDPPVLKAELGSSKSKSLNDVEQQPQECLQVKSGNEDLSHVRDVEEKRKFKEREKLKRIRVSEGRDNIVSLGSPSRKDFAQSAANAALREAKDLKHRADRLNGKEGMGREQTDLYLSAALTFLHAAALLEPVCSESAKNGEITQSMLVYTDTAKLCKYCAITYERENEMAAAALAYKCVGLARMRVVLARSVCMKRDQAELQAAHLRVLPGESPSSSTTSDVDNLNNHVQPMDRQQMTTAKDAASPSLAPQMSGNHIIPARCRPSYLRLLQYAADVNAALEALSKSQSAYMAADVGSLGARYGEEGMVAVKKVVDFSFYDVESLLRLVRLALEAIGH